MKRGVSVVIGYVLLIALTVVMGSIVYLWLKTYVPTDIEKCPEGVSIMIENISCNDDDISIKVKNNGRFSINAFYIKAVTDPNKDVATVSLKRDSGNYGRIPIYVLNRDLKPSEKIRLYLQKPGIGIYKIEVTPIKFKNENSVKKRVVCSNSKAIEEAPAECHS